MSDAWYNHEGREQQWNTPHNPFNTRLPKETGRLDLKLQASLYLENRGLNPELAWLNDWYVTEFLVPDKNLVDHRLARLVIPAVDPQNPENRFYQTRSLGDPRDPFPRYDSPHRVRRGGAVVRVVPMGGLPEWTPTLLVEGPMCALAGAGAGFPSLATMGGSPAEEALLSVLMLVPPGTSLLVIPDSDKPDLLVDAVRRMISTAHKSRRPMPNLRVKIPAGAKDLSEIPPELRKGWLTEGCFGT